MTTSNHLNNFAEPDSETLKDLSKTADRLLKVRNLDADNIEYLAKTLFYLKRYDESIRQFKRILSLKSDDETSLTFIAIGYFKKGDYESAAEYLSRSLKNKPESETLLSYMMLSYEFLKDYPGAVRCGEKILKANPENKEVIKRMINYHYELRNYEECIAYMNLIEFSDRLKKAQILYEMKRYDESIEVSSKLKTAEAYHLTAKAYKKLGNTVKAVKYLYKTYEKELNTDILFEISDIYFEVEDYQRSLYFLKEILLHDESNIKAHNLIALAYLNSQKWHDAIEYCEKTLEISKKEPEAYATLAEAYFQIDCNFKKANEILEEGLSENPESAELWVKKGGFNYPYDMVTFKKSYEKAISLKPDDYEIYREYIYLLLSTDNIEDAKRYYNRMLLINPLYEKSFSELKDSMSF